MCFGRAIAANRRLLKQRYFINSVVGGDIKAHSVPFCPSERSSASEFGDPVTITGLPRFSSMKESADAVYAIVGAAE